MYDNSSIKPYNNRGLESRTQRNVTCDIKLDEERSIYVLHVPRIFLPCDLFSIKYLYCTLRVKKQKTYQVLRVTFVTAG